MRCTNSRSAIVTSARLAGLEAKHRRNAGLCAPTILLGHVVEVFRGPQLFVFRDRILIRHFTDRSVRRGITVEREARRRPTLRLHAPCERTPWPWPHPARRRMLKAYLSSKSVPEPNTLEISKLASRYIGPFSLARLSCNATEDAGGWSLANITPP